MKFNATKIPKKNDAIKLFIEGFLIFKTNFFFKVILYDYSQY